MTHRSTATDIAMERALDDIDEVGYTIVPDAVAETALTHYREALERLYETDPGVRAKQAGPNDRLHVENLPDKGRIFERYFLNERVFPIVQQLVGEDCILKDAWSLALPPHGRCHGAIGTLHHEDAVPLATPVLSVVTLYPLVPLTMSNGGLCVVPGSHLWERSPTPGEEVDETVVEAPAGSCIVFLGSLWHRGGVNSSDSIRTMMGACYTRPWIKPFFDFARALSAQVVERASPRARHLFGFDSTAPYTERWLWDYEAGRPKDPGC